MPIRIENVLLVVIFSDFYAFCESSTFFFYNMASEYVKVGLLTCQQHVFTRTLRSVVLSCTEVTESHVKTPTLEHSPAFSSLSSGTKVGTSRFHVVCNDSVLFPRGGGQDCDYGWLFKSEEALQRSMTKKMTRNSVEGKGMPSSPPSAEEKKDDVGIPVVEVGRKGDCCVMTTSVPVEVGTVVWQMVDWPRRFDNMQHHTGQHLLTAVIEDVMGLPTTSVAFTFPFCYVQIDISSYLRREEEGENYQEDPKHPLLPPGSITKDRTIAPHVLRMLEERCNAFIRDEASLVDITIYSTREELYEAMQSVESRFRSRSIPEDVTGPIRTITLRNVDQCTCCGTHVEHLRQLQVLHVLPQQEVKNSIVKVFFVVGERAIQYFNEMFARERQLVVQLSGCRPENFISELQERSKAMMQTERKLKQAMIEIAELKAVDLITQSKKEPSGPAAKVLFHLRNDGDMEYFSAFRTGMNEHGAADTILVGGWATEPVHRTGNTGNKVVGNKSGDAAGKASGQVIVMVGGGLNIMPKKTPASKKGKDVATKDNHVDVQEDEKEQLRKKMKKRFDLVCQVLQKELGDVKGGVSPQGFRGKGSLLRWNEMVAAVQAAVAVTTE